MDYQYNKGSIWRKWDFHTHTLGTNKNDQFKSKDFKEFCITLFIKALENEIEAIGITDYFSIENYMSVYTFQQKIDSVDIFNEIEKARIKNIFIFPNVELRMLPVTDSGRLINFHCIFNPVSLNNLDDDFFSTVSHVSHDQEYKMNRSGIIRLGKSLDPSLTDDTAYKKGIENFVVSHDSFKKLLTTNINLRNNLITVVSNSNKDGASALQQHFDLFETEGGSLDAIRATIYNLSQCIFSGNPNDREYFLGNKKDDEKTVVRKCGSLKPCIHGSDAHTEDKLFKPDNDRYCWVKADLSFNGLKQILCEPSERVRIQRDSPDCKKPYNIIEKVKFIDKKANKTFTDYEIGINPNLNAIIGGKSSGKSLPLHFIAEKIGNPTDIKNYSSITKDVDIEIFYADDPNNAISISDKRVIEFLPQLYIEDIVRNKSITATHQGGESNAFNKFIEALIRQEDDINELFDNHINMLESSEDRINANVSEWIKYDKQYKIAKVELQPLGDKNAISNEIKRQQAKIDELTKHIGLTSEEIQTYNQLSQENTRLEEEIKQFNFDESELDRLGRYLTDSLNLKVVNSFDFNSSSFKIDQIYQNIKTDILKSFLAHVESEKKELATIKKELCDQR